MAISHISGRMLRDNLERDANLSIATDVVYIDIINGRLGVKTTTPSATLSVTGTATVTGNITAGNITTAGIANIGTLTVTSANGITSTTISATGNITGGNIITAGIASVANISISAAIANTIMFANSSKMLTSTSNLTFNGTTLTLTGSANIDNLQFDGTSISSNANVSVSSSANGNISLIPNGTGLVVLNTTNGVLLPVGGTATRPTSPLTSGVMRYNSDLTTVEFYTGSTWRTVSLPFASMTSQTITGDNTTVTFTLNNTVSSASAVIVVIGGTVQTPGIAYTISPGTNQITFTEAPLNTDEVVVRFISESTTVSSVTDIPGTTYFKANSATLSGVVAGNTIFQATNTNIFNISSAHSIQLPVYTVVQANALSNKAVGQVIYVSNGDLGSASLAVYDGASWRRISFGTTISA